MDFHGKLDLFLFVSVCMQQGARAYEDMALHCSSDLVVVTNIAKTRVDLPPVCSSLSGRPAVHQMTGLSRGPISVKTEYYTVKPTTQFCSRMDSFLVGSIHSDSEDGVCSR